MESERSPQLSRREFLIGAVGLAAAGRVSEALAGKPQAELDAKEQEQYEALVNEIEGYVTAFAEADTHLSRREIKAQLDRCPFLEQRVPILTLDTKRLEEDLEPHTEGEALDYALAKNNLDLPRNGLVVLQADFEMLKVSGEAFYDTQYQALFVDQQPPKRKSFKLQRSIYSGVMNSELHTRRNTVIDAMSDQPRDTVLAELAKVEDQFAQEYPPRKRGDIKDIPPELLLRYQNNIRAAVTRTRVEAATQFVSNRTSLNHEAFHHFYETMFSSEGYDGPSQADALALALKGIRDRDAVVQASKYAPAFFKRGLLEQSAVDMQDDASIDAFAKTISERFDFSRFPAGEADTPVSQDRIAVYQLVNEFLARIYNGALGNTDVVYEQQVQEAVNDIPFVQIDASARTRDLQYHTPTQQELEFLRSMHWDGKSIISL